MPSTIPDSWEVPSPPTALSGAILAGVSEVQLLVNKWKAPLLVVVSDIINDFLMWIP